MYLVSVHAKSPAGYYCGLGQTGPLTCPRGHYCPTKTKITNIPQCPPGTYNNLPAQHNISSCLLCPAGYYCPYYAMNTTKYQCEAGFYCQSGASTSQGKAGILGGVGGKCPKGYYCLKGTTFNESYPCPPGTYQPMVGGKNKTICVSCTPGYYCLGSANWRVSGACALGYYCPRSCEDSRCSNEPCKGNCAHPTPYMTPAYAQGGICPNGHYCPQTTNAGGTIGATAPVMCVPGTYAADSGMGACVTCPAGTWCGYRFNSPVRCPSGYYCIRGTKHQNEFPCPQGTYNPSYNASNISACALCPPGQYCAKQGLNATSRSAWLGTTAPPGRDLQRGHRESRRNSRTLPSWLLLPKRYSISGRFPLPARNIQPIREVSQQNGVSPMSRRVLIFLDLPRPRLR